MLLKLKVIDGEQTLNTLDPLRNCYITDIFILSQPYQIGPLASSDHAGFSQI